MTIPVIIIYLSMFVWLFPPLRQRKTIYFTFFLINALMDPILHILYKLFHFMPLSFYPVMAGMFVISLLSKGNIKWKMLFMLVMSLISWAIYDNPFLLRIICLVLLIVIFAILLTRFINHINRHRTINLFLMLFMFYEVINLLKFLSNILKHPLNMVSFYLATFCEIFIAIAFMFITIERPNIPLIKEK
jgi:hypothetical protein